MRYNKLEQPKYLTELDLKNAQTIYKAKLEIFDIKINFKGLYPSNLLCPFCNVVKEDFSHIINCKFGPVVFPVSVRGQIIYILSQACGCLFKFLVFFDYASDFCRLSFISKL